MTDQVPTGVPVLGAGRHPDPTHGVCLMELTAFLAGEPHSDHPRCTHPVLAAVARVANDACSDTARPALARLAPRLVGTSDTGQRTTSTLIELCASSTALLAPPIWRPRLLRALRQNKRRRLDAAATRTLSDRQLASAARTATIAATSLAFATTRDRDEAMQRLLLACLDAYDAASSTATSSPGVSSPEVCSVSGWESSLLQATSDTASVGAAG